MRKIKYVFGLAILLIVSISMADVIPIEDASSNTASNAVPAQTQTEDQSQSLQQLTQQMQNFAQMNLPQQIDNLRQQVQALQGQLEDQNHQIQVLTQQLRNFYQDLDQRVTKLQQQKTQTSTTGIDNTMGSPEEQEYQNAFSLLSSRQYDKAVQLLQQYLTDYPDGKYAANAHYWLGEIYYLQSNIDQSAVEMLAVIKNFPKSAKVPDAMLKIAMIYNTQKKYAQARDELQQIISQYPDSSAAQIAEQQLPTVGASS